MAQPPPHPVFVGGTQRSGTSILGRLIGKHSRFERIREIQFHTNPGGLVDYIAGRVTLADFVERLRTAWWKREYRRTAEEELDVRGLFRFVDEADFERAVAAFEERAPGDPRGAAGRLVLDLIDPVAERAGKESWVESTPTTAAAAVTLFAMLPGMKLIHVVRDGRDVACSVVTFAWGPSDVVEAIRWWGGRLREADAGARALPEDRVLTLQLEDLLADDREAAFASLLDFLEVEDERPMRSWFDRIVTPESGHVGRWRTEIPAERLDEALATYESVVDDLRAGGVASTPPVRD